jgi:ABC-type multidrug transport system fused ATPase/permease subunit
MSGTDFFAALARGAALGSTLGPVGAGAGAAAAVVAELADATGLSRWLFGDKAAETKAAVAQAVELATGASDPAAQGFVLERDPEAAGRLREALAGIAAARQAAHEQAQLDTFRAQLADVANARSQTLSLAASHSILAWGAPVVSVITLLSYGVIAILAVWLTAHSDLPPNAVAILSLVLGAASSMAAGVVAFWTGSSAGSQAKSDTIAKLAGASQPPTP